MSDYKLLINGELVDGDDTMDVINPATEEVLATCARASIAQADAAIAAAKEAYKTWGKTPRRSAGLAFTSLLTCSMHAPTSLSAY